jgi:hypothetical protein
MCSRTAGLWRMAQLMSMLPYESIAEYVLKCINAIRLKLNSTQRVVSSGQYEAVLAVALQLRPKLAANRNFVLHGIHFAQTSIRGLKKLRLEEVCRYDTSGPDVAQALGYSMRKASNPVQEIGATGMAGFRARRSVCCRLQ